jgi:ubiquinone/menaquinone biosynthesis C-methylase UbiE
VTWQAYVDATFSFSEFPAPGVVLDVGCGPGNQLAELEGHGHTAFGIDVNDGALDECRRRGLRVLKAYAEDLPVKTSSLDGLVCKVVLPLTVEHRAVAEIARVLKTGGRGHLCVHGAGYYLRYLLRAPSWKLCVYGLRTLVNTWLYAASGRQLPGFLGDTLYQSERRLSRYYRQAGLRLSRRAPSRGFLGFPVFIYHTIERVA